MMAPRLRSSWASAAAVARSAAATVVVDDPAAVEPGLQVAEEPLVVEVLAPQGVERAPGFDQRRVQVEQPNQTGPLPLPVGDGQDRPLVPQQPSEHLLAELPDPLRHDQGSAPVDVRQHRQTLRLAGDEPVTPPGVVGMRARQRSPLRGERGGQLVLERRLGLPAHAVG
jgi:hypothetical protein